MRRLGTLMLLPLMAAGAAFGAVPEPNGFRTSEYRAAVPTTVAGGSVVHAAQLRELVQHGEVVLIDVYPAPRRPAGMRADAPWLPPAHRNLPDSLWWPEIGLGAIPPALEVRFRQRLVVKT